MRKTTAIALATAALPALALAAPAAAAAPKPVLEVKAHVNGSVAALKLAIRLNAGGHDAAAFKAFLKSRTELGKARADVIALLKGAKTPLARTNAANALALLGKLEDGNITRLTNLLDDVEGAFQKAVGKANLNDTAARDRAIGILQALLPGLPGIAQGPISSVIGALMSGNPAQLAGQASLLGEKLLPDVKKMVSAAVGVGLQGQAQALVGIQSIIGAVPGPAQAQLDAALQLAKSQTEMAFGMIDSALGMAPAPIRGMVSGILGQVQAMLGGMFGMFGQPVAAPAAPAAPAPAPATPAQPAAPAPSVAPNLETMMKCIFPNGVPTPAALAGGGLAGMTGFDPTKIAGCFIGGGLPDPTGIINCIFPSGIPTGGVLPAGFDPTKIAGCVLKMVPDPLGILKAMPNPMGMLNCVFPTGAPAGATAIPFLPAGFDPFKIAGCVMQSMPFFGGGLIPNPMQLVGSFMGAFNPFNFMSGFFGGGTPPAGGTSGGGFMGGLFPF